MGYNNKNAVSIYYCDWICKKGPSTLWNISYFINILLISNFAKHDIILCEFKYEIDYIQKLEY